MVGCVENAWFQELRYWTKGMFCSLPDPTPVSLLRRCLNLQAHFVIKTSRFEVFCSHARTSKNFDASRNQNCFHVRDRALFALGIYAGLRGEIWKCQVSWWDDHPDCTKTAGASLSASLASVHAYP